MEARPETAEWTSWLKAQCDYAAAQLAELPRRASITRAIEAYGADAAVVFLNQVTADHVYFMSRAPNKQSFSLWRRPIDGGTAALLIDPDPLSQDGKPARITFADASPDGNFLAYGLDAGGNEIEALHILTIATREDHLVTSINSRQSSWLPDSSAYLYHRLRADAVFGSVDYNKGSSVWLHRLDGNTDTEVFRSGEGPGGAALYDVSMPQVKAFANSDHVLAVHMVNGNSPGAIYVARTAELSVGKTPWQQVAWPDDVVGDSDSGTEPLAASIIGNDIYVLARGGASRGMIWKVPIASPGRENRTIVVPEGTGTIDRFCAASDGLYFHEIRGGLEHALKRYSFSTGKIEEVTLPRDGAVWGMVATLARPGAWFGMDGLAWPAMTVATSGNLVAHDTGLSPQPGYDVTGYVTRRFDVPARDGTAIPVEMLYARSTTPTGANPTLIEAYGAYGTPLDPGFQSSVLAFLDQGGIMVYAHVRGGGEKGDAWHRAGQKATKPNTWRDAIDVAEYLVKARWTAPRHLALWGTSAGGIMVGRAITERPDLFAVAIGEVGCFNTLRMELTANGPGNDVEFGTVKKEDEFHALYAMDSYHHVVDGTRYPAVLCITGANDLRIEPWMVGKFAARLQAASVSGKPVLLRVDYSSGHSASAKKSGIEKRSDIYAFVLHHADNGSA
jgi:prolyl oligopeptidase